MEQKELTCQSCALFRPLYLRKDEFESVTFQKTDAGLCVTPRIKTRREGSAVCEHYTDASE